MHTGFCPLLFGVAVGLSPDVLHSCFQEQARAVGQGGSFPSTAADFEGYAKRINDMGPLAKIVEGACHYLARYGSEISQTDGADVATERLRRLQQSNSRSNPPAYPTVDQVDILYHITSGFLADTLDDTENLFDKIFPGLGGEVSPENIYGESVGLKGNGIPPSVEGTLSGPSSFIPMGGNLTGLDQFISSNFGNASCSGDSPFDFNTTLNFSDPTLVGPPTDIDIIFEGPFGSNQTFRVRNLPTADLTFPQQDVGVEFPPGTAALGNFTNEEIEEDENTEGPETSLLQKIQNATGGAGQLFDRIRLNISVARLSRCAQDLVYSLAGLEAGSGYDRLLPPGSSSSILSMDRVRLTGTLQYPREPSVIGAPPNNNAQTQLNSLDLSGIDKVVELSIAHTRFRLPANVTRPASIGVTEAVTVEIVDTDLTRLDLSSLTTASCAIGIGQNPDLEVIELCSLDRAQIPPPTDFCIECSANVTTRVLVDPGLLPDISSVLTEINGPRCVFEVCVP